MGMQNTTPHLSTVQRNSLSNQIRDGFLIYNTSIDKYERWSISSRGWEPVGGGTLTQSDKANLKAELVSEYDLLNLGSGPDALVTNPEADSDWANA